MPSLFPEMWLSRAVELFRNAENDSFLRGIQEIDTDVLELGSGTASEQNIINIPIHLYKPTVGINMVGQVPYEDFTSTAPKTIQLDRYQSYGTQVYDNQIMGASYDLMDPVIGSHVREINIKKVQKALWNLGPTSSTTNTPILKTSGEVTIAGMKRLTYNDLVAAKKAMDDQECPTEGRVLVLSTDHYNDLLLDRANFANLLVDHAKGTTNPIIAGFEIMSHVSTPVYNATSKFVLGSIPNTTSAKASIFFLRSNVAKKTGLTKQYFKDAKTDPINQSNMLNYRHYFVATPILDRYLGAITSVQ